MTQRLKHPDTDKEEARGKYVRQLTLLHQMLISAMKAKQTTDLTNVEQLRSLLDDFSIAYLGRKVGKQD